MLLPLVGIPELIAEGLRPYRDLFCRAAGFEHVSRYVTGLLLSPNKTLQGVLSPNPRNFGTRINSKACYRLMLN